MKLTNNVAAIRINDCAARAGHTAPNSAYVLLTSLLLATSSMSLAWIVPSLLG
jgi:hypothetical protein